jgi:tetratricopeptide (TPR) repeat protein
VAVDAPRPTPRAATAALCAGVALLAAAVMAPAIEHAWINYDDDVYLTGNPRLALGLGREGIAWAFTTFHGANWFPLTWLSWMLDFELYGLDPAGFHATNVALHAATAALLCGALARLTGAPGRSAFVAAVFAVHPLHVESVAWAAARKDVLSGLFFALSLLVYAPRGGGAPTPGRRAAVFACLALGLMAKPTLVTLPCVLLLLDFWPLGRLTRDGRLEWARLRRAIVEKLPLFALVAAMCGAVIAAQRAGGALVDFERLPWPTRLANAPVAVCAYVAKAFWPSRLAVIYPHPGDSLSAWRVAAAGAALAAATVLAWLARRRLPAVSVGWLWFLGMLVPVIGLVQVGSQAMADRYTYLPLVGLAIAVAWGTVDLARARGAARLAPAVALAAVAALALAARGQLWHWRNSAALFSHALAVTEDNHIAHAHLGSALLERGEAEAAAAHFREAIRLRPDFLEVANNLAWLLATSDDDAVRNPYLALELAQRAANLSGGSDPVVLDTLAAAFAASGRFDAALVALRRALELSEAGTRPELAPEFRERLALYRARRAYRERRAPVTPPAPGPPAGAP